MRAAFAELAVTALPLVALWLASWFAFSWGYSWASLLIAVPAAGFLVRLFMIQHDCGHGAFFSNRWANDWTGRVIGVLTLDAYDLWRRTHAIHHATTGNLGRRGIGDMNTLTVARIWRAFALGPAQIPALPASAGDVRCWPRLSVFSAASPALGADARRLAALGQHHGDQSRDRAHRRRPRLADRHQGIPARSCSDRRCSAATIGVWLFYVQHQFEHTVWALRGRVEFARSGLARQFALRSARVRCAGSRPISACITSITSAAASPITGCRRCCATIRNSAISAG